MDEQYAEAQSDRLIASDKTSLARSRWNSGDTINAVDALIGAVRFTIGVVKELIGTDFGLPYLYPLPHFLRNYTVEEAGEEYELTAAKIMSAWIDADNQTRLMTVLTIDELRREVWDQEFVSYRIAPAES